MTNITDLARNLLAAYPRPSCTLQNIRVPSPAAALRRAGKANGSPRTSNMKASVLDSCAGCSHSSRIALSNVDCVKQGRGQGERQGELGGGAEQEQEQGARWTAAPGARAPDNLRSQTPTAQTRGRGMRTGRVGWWQRIGRGAGNKRHQLCELLIPDVAPTTLQCLPLHPPGLATFRAVPLFPNPPPPLTSLTPHTLFGPCSAFPLVHPPGLATIRAVPLPPLPPSFTPSPSYRVGPVGCHAQVKARTTCRHKTQDTHATIHMI